MFEGVDANAGVEFGVAFLDQAALLEDAEVAAERGGRQGECRGEVAGAARLVAQKFDGAAAMRVGEGG